MWRKHIRGISILAGLLGALSTVSDVRAREVRRSHAGVRIADVSSFDIDGIRLGMSPDEVGAKIRRRFGTGARVLCDGCILEYSTNPQSFDCDASATSDEPSLVVIEDNLRLEVKFYHKNGSGASLCYAYSIRFDTGGYIPDRDNVDFDQGVIKKYGNPTTKEWHDFYKFYDYYWCSKLTPQDTISHCDSEYPMLSATIYTAASEFQSGGLTAIIKLEDLSGPARAARERTLRETPRPSLHF